jgi:hypothetical protein
MGLGNHYETLIAEAKKNNDIEEYDRLTDQLFGLLEERNKNIYGQMKLNEEKAKSNNVLNYVFQSSILILTASIPLINFIENSKIPTIAIAVVATILIGMTNLFKFRDHALIKRQTNQKLLQECRWFSSARGPYSNYSLGSASDIFLDRTDEIQNEGFEQVLTLEKFPQKYPNQTNQK